MSSDYFPLTSSYLCVDCQVITPNAMECPCCASKHSLMGLATVLSREPSAVHDGLERAIEKLNDALSEYATISLDT